MRKLFVIVVLFLATTMEIGASTDPNFDPNVAMKDRYSIVENIAYTEYNVELTFYTDTYSCNGRWDKLTASGATLNPLTLAVPRQKNSNKPIFPFGTKVEIEGLGTRTVQDTGSRNYIKIKSDGTIILDVFVPRLAGESDAQYLKRVRNMGRVKSTAKFYGTITN